jgi:hypothetical protein
MARRKPVVIDGITTFIPETATLNQILPFEARSVTTDDGQLISRDRFTQAPVPTHFRVNLSEIEKGADTRALLADELKRVQGWLNGFEPSPSGPRRAVLHATQSFLLVYRCPLPDQFEIDEINLALDVGQYPSLPPIGLYVSNNNAAAAAQLEGHFRRFQDKAFHSAKDLRGFTWICFAYKDNRWNFNARDPNRSDNVAKFLDSFYCAAQEVLQ